MLWFSPVLQQGYLVLLLATFGVSAGSWLGFVCHRMLAPLLSYIAGHRFGLSSELSPGFVYDLASKLQSSFDLAGLLYFIQTR